MRTLTLALLALLPLAANAQEARPLAPALPSIGSLIDKAKRQLIMPPAQYDKPYLGKLIIVPARDKEDVQIRCNLPKPYLACSFARPLKNECEIIKVSDEQIMADGYLPHLVMRHEEAHCAGWTGKHENVRTPTQRDIDYAVATYNMSRR